MRIGLGTRRVRAAASGHEIRRPILHIKDGRTVEPERPNVLSRYGRFLSAPFVVAWHHRDLVATVLRRELHERFKGSIAGWIWAIVAPLLALVTYTFVFRGAVQLPGGTSTESRSDYALFIFGGVIAFNFFIEMAYRAPSLLHEYAHFIKQTMFPAEMLPLISTLRAAAYTCVALVLMVAAQLVLSGSLHWTALLLPLWLIPFVAFLTGMSWLLAAMGAFTRDTSYLMMTVAPLLMFITPIFFSQEGLSPRIKLMLYVNPLTGYIEIVRDIMVVGTLPSLVVCAWTLSYSLLTFWFGFWFFSKFRDRIADVI